MVRILFRVCFILLWVPIIALCIWLPIIYMAIGSAFPGLIGYWSLLLIAEIVSLALYFKSPWVAAVIGWIDMTVILCGLIPWKGHNAHSFLQQFWFDLLFFIAAQIGFLTWKAGRLRARSI